MGRRRFASKYWTPENWDDASYSISSGYYHVYRPDHPVALKSGGWGWVKRCLAVYWLATGQTVPSGYELHHKNEIRTDDRFENLEILPLNAHRVLHASKPKIELICNYCSKAFSIRQRDFNKGLNRFCSMYCYEMFRAYRQTKGVVPAVTYA